MSKKPTVFVIYYSMYGHVQTMAREIIKGLEANGVNAKLFQIAETLPQEVLTKMHAPAKATDVPVINVKELAEADGFLFGIPTRFGMLPAQLKAFFDQCGQLWMSGALAGKFVGTFFSTGSLGGGQETTALMCVPFFTHMGMCFVPYSFRDKSAGDISTVVHGGSMWGSGTIAGGDGSRAVTDLEKKMAQWQGSEFAKLLNRRAQASQPETKVEEKKTELKKNDDSKKEEKKQVDDSKKEEKKQVDESKKSSASMEPSEKKKEEQSCTCDIL